jgi:hypothetical protein
MAITKKEKKEVITPDDNVAEKIKLSPNDPEWTDHVLSFLKEDEKISGNPTTDGLRRIFESVLNCTMVESVSDVVQSPCSGNDKRATVVHKISFVINDHDMDTSIKYRSVSGAADVYWGNCDKIYRNHPVAVAETRAEGRALRRGLKLRKVVAAEEIAKDIEDDINGSNVNKITNNQINFIDVIAKRIDVNIIELIKTLNLEIKDNNVYSLHYDNAVLLITKLSDLQRTSDQIDSSIKGYDSNWK